MLITPQFARKALTDEPAKTQFPGSCDAISGFRYYNTNTGRWLSRDPLGEDGGVHLFGFVRNNPMQFIDMAGLYTWSMDIEKCSITLNYTVALDFVDTYTKWTPERKLKFESEFKAGVESDWNNSGIRFVAKSKTGADCCGCPSGVVPRLNLIMVSGGSADWKPGVRPNPSKKFIQSNVDMMDEEDNVQFGQRTSSHEFGHSIGLQHPGAVAFYKVWLWGRDQYRYLGSDEDGHVVNGSNELMGAGSGFRGFYFDKWKEELNRRQKCNYETIEK